MAKTIEAAVGKWRGILTGLGVDEAFLVNKHGPCPICSGNTRFRFDDKDGKGTWICNHCGAGDGMKLALMVSGLEFKDLAKKIDGLIGNIQPDSIKFKNEEKRDPIILLKKISGGLARLNGEDPASLYLASRGLGLSKHLWFHESIGYYEDGKHIGSFPALVAPIVNKDGKAISLHVTYLTRDGKKAPVDSQKKIMPAVEKINGSAIRLIESCDGHVSVAEGIETALAVMKKFTEPCWACISANNLEAFTPPAGISCVSIYADNDESFTGQKSAYALAHRLKREGFEVSVKMPDKTGTDWADY